MQPLRLAVVLGTPLLAVVAVLVACGDDTAVPIPGGNTSSTSGAPTKGTSGGSKTDDDDDTKGDDDDDDTNAKDSGVDADCTKAASLHHTDAGFFCDFYDGGPLSANAGGKKNCPTGTTCCNPTKGSATAYPPSYCAEGVGVQACADKAADNGSTWTPGTAWECASASNCDNKKCCAVSYADATDGGYVNYGNTPAGDKAPPAACHEKTLFKVGGTRCQSECAAGTEIELCSTNDKCSNGKSCIPVSTGASSNRDLGVCPK